MSIIVNEQKMLTENMFEYEDRVKSPLNKYIDKTFTPVEYFHIRNNDTTTDGGWIDVEEILGDRSPVRFQVIHDLPIAGIENITINLSETDIGLDGSYEGEGIILPGTVVPLQNDFFIIRILKDKYIFRVTEVQYDTIMPDNFYKISFVLDNIDAGKQEDLVKQTVRKTTCLIDNIGTSERCIIEDDYYDDIRKINNMYSEMLNDYITFFYNNKYNCLLGDWGDGYKIYDPLQREFIHNNGLFKVKKQIDTIVFNELFIDPRRKIKYENSIYRFIELRDTRKLTQFPYYVFRGTNNKQTPFSRWNDKNVFILDIQANMGDNPNVLLSQESVNTIKMNYPTNSKYLKLISNYIHRDEINISEIDLTLGEELLMLSDSNLEVFIFTPIILYILRSIVNKFMIQYDKQVIK